MIRAAIASGPDAGRLYHAWCDWLGNEVPSPDAINRVAEELRSLDEDAVKFLISELRKNLASAVNQEASGATSDASVRSTNEIGHLVRLAALLQAICWIEPHPNQ